MDGNLGNVIESECTERRQRALAILANARQFTHRDDLSKIPFPDFEELP